MEGLRCFVLWAVWELANPLPSFLRDCAQTDAHKGSWCLGNEARKRPPLANSLSLTSLFSVSLSPLSLSRFDISRVRSFKEVSTLISLVANPR